MLFLFPFEKQKLKDFASPNNFSFDIKLHAAFLALGAETFVYSAEHWQHWCGFPSRAC